MNVFQNRYVLESRSSYRKKTAFHTRKKAPKRFSSIKRCAVKWSKEKCRKDDGEKCRKKKYRRQKCREEKYRKKHIEIKNDRKLVN